MLPGQASTPPTIEPKPSQEDDFALELGGQNRPDQNWDITAPSSSLDSYLLVFQGRAGQMLEFSRVPGLGMPDPQVFSCSKAGQARSVEFSRANATSHEKTQGDQ